MSHTHHFWKVAVGLKGHGVNVSTNKVVSDSTETVVLCISELIFIQMQGLF